MGERQQASRRAANAISHSERRGAAGKETAVQRTAVSPSDDNACYDEARATSSENGERAPDWVPDDDLMCAFGLGTDYSAPNDAPGQAPGTPVSSGSQVDAPAAAYNRAGFVDSDDGSNIRTRPAELLGSIPLTAAPLPPATRVFVSGHHPQTPDWWYVTAFLPDSIVRGYVQGLRIATELPEPTARLYQIQPGDTAEGLARKEFSSAARDGHDLRYYENVLLYVNQQHGRAGMRGAYQEPGLLGGGSNNVQLEAGRRIWLVSSAYARALESAVPDGSLTNGAVAKVKRFAGHVEDLLASVTQFPAHLPEVAGEYARAIHDHAAQIVGVLAGFLMAEAASMALAVTPGGQIPAIMIQLALAAFGAHGAATAAVQALEHAGRWLQLAWNASGREQRIAEASKELVRMLVSVAMAALAFLGVKANMGKAASFAAGSMPAMMPALAVSGGGEIAEAGAAVAAGIPEPFGPFGTAMAMSTNDSARSPTPGEGPDPSRFNSPARRHRAADVRMKTVAKADNTVIEPGVDVTADIAAIRSGQVPRVRGQYTVNGRTYGEHGGTLFPISGRGFHYLTRPQFKALGVYNEFGNTPRAMEILDNMGIASTDRASALRVHEAIQ